MSLAKRIIPCLDVKEGRTVKGVQFSGMRDLGDPVELAVRYAAEGADELVFLDISATLERRRTLVPLVARVAAAVNIPFTVGGGITHEDDVYRLLAAGCDKVSVNSTAVREPALINRLARRYGSQCVVVAIDARLVDERYEVMTHAGKRASGLEAIAWARQAQDLGAGEILLTAIDRDGTKEGFDLALTAGISEALHIPVIASGGAGSAAHFAAVFGEGKADAALAAGIFHRQELSIPDLKAYLKSQNILVR